jgi:hypothetical protein
MLANFTRASTSEASDTSKSEESSLDVSSVIFHLCSMMTHVPQFILTEHHYTPTGLPYPYDELTQTWDRGIACITGQSQREVEPYFDAPFGKDEVRDVDVDVDVEEDSEVNL